MSRLTGFSSKAGFAAHRFFTLFTTLTFYTFRSILTPFWPPFGALFRCFWEDFADTGSPPYVFIYFVDFSSNFKHCSYDFFMYFQRSVETSSPSIAKSDHAETLRLRSDFKDFHSRCFDVFFGFILIFAAARLYKRPGFVVLLSTRCTSQKR